MFRSGARNREREMGEEIKSIAFNLLCLWFLLLLLFNFKLNFTQLQKKDKLVEIFSWTSFTDFSFDIDSELVSVNLLLVVFFVFVSFYKKKAFRKFWFLYFCLWVYGQMNKLDDLLKSRGSNANKYNLSDFSIYVSSLQ